jgi:hypothetical protein
LMDDVWVVIGLLLFGSLLFCLCCYKVTNLLYMLYHIDDSTDSLTGHDLISVTTASAVTTSGALAAAPIALALEGGSNGPNNGGGQQVQQQPQRPQSANSMNSTSHRGHGQPHIHHNSYDHFAHMNHAPSTPTLYPLAQVRKTTSATSLSVGVQYDPRDVVDAPHQQQRGGHRHNAAAVEYITASNGLRGSHRRAHIHVSAPDFHLPSEVSRHHGQRHSQHSTTPYGVRRPQVEAITTQPSSSSQQAQQPYHHHYHHHHHSSSNKSTSTPGGNSRPLGASSSSRASDFFLTTASTTARNHSLHRGAANQDYGAYFGSLGRSSTTHHRGATGSSSQIRPAQISLSESEPDGWSNLNSPTSGQPPPMKTARLSNEKWTSTARRYGSIRVAECRFVEAESQPSTPTASMCDDSTVRPLPPEPTATFLPSYNQYSASTYGLVTSPSSALPLPPSPSITDKIMCNGPMSIGGNRGSSIGRGLSSFRPRRQPSPTRGSNGQHSHIIPPPQNFGNNGGVAGGRLELTTTRIGSAVNVSCSTRPEYWPSSHHRSPPPF